MSYDYSGKKIVAVLASNLEIGIAFNVLGHIALSMGAYAEDDIMGRKELCDKSGINHFGISKYPFIITKVKPGRLKRLVNEAREANDLLMIDYPKEMLDTAHDDELADQISQKENSDIEYLGAVIYGDSKTVSSLTGKFMLWK
ncbi:MAG: DUF2000 domain-containing protein [Calditrichaeota bacterium]|nr:MAG: DUF2000 domain-containing protein [Calditrichota bacterium]GJQ61147.1 MAG: hypothetical protein SCALA702_02000 [Melioribacteraceae bacterium]